MYARRDVIEHFKKWVWFYTPIAIVLLGGIVWAGETHWHYEKLLKKNEGARELLAQKTMYMNVATILQACCVWFAIFSLVGLTEKYITKPNKKTTYIVYSSYWVYLFHRPLCVWLRGAVHTMGHAGGGQVHDRHRNRLGVVHTHLPFSRPEHVGRPDAERQKEPLKRHRAARSICTGSHRQRIQHGGLKYVFY